MKDDGFNNQLLCNLHIHRNMGVVDGFQPYYEGYFYAKDSIASNKIIVTSIPANKAKTFNADEYLKKNKITKTIKV